MKLKELGSLLGCELDGDGEIEIKGVGSVDAVAPGQITLWAPGTGSFDYLNYEIYLSPENDLTGDLKVDLADFAVIADYWLNGI